MKSFSSHPRSCRSLLYGALAVLTISAAPYLKADTIDDYVRAQMNWERIPGLSIAVIRDGKVIKVKGYGLANVETNTPATPETVYKIGSVSKQFLAAGMMLLVQDGKVGLDDPVSKYLDGTPETWKDITVRRLLTHTSGIERESPNFDPMKIQPDLEVIKATYPLPLRFVPGSKWEYSNINYYCVAEIIRKVTGAPWSEFLKKRIFVPVQMTATRTTTTTEIVPNRASGYATGENGLGNAEAWIALRPSGAFLSTVTDFMKWDAALYSDNILTATSENAMWTPVKLNNGNTFHYGFGWFVDSVNGHQHLHHNGGVPGFVAEFDRFPDNRISMVLMANIQNRDLSDLAAKIAAFYDPTLRTPAPPSLPGADPRIATQMRGIITDLSLGKLTKEQFAPNLASHLSMQLQAGAFKPLESLGQIERFDLIGMKKNPDSTLYNYRVIFKGITLFADYSVGNDGKILAFALSD